MYISVMKIEKDTLDKLKAALPHGAIKQIATTLSYSYEYTCGVFSGKFNTNLDMIREAQKIIRDAKDNKETLEKEINNTLKTK